MRVNTFGVRAETHKDTIKDELKFWVTIDVRKGLADDYHNDNKL